LVGMNEGKHALGPSRVRKGETCFGSWLGKVSNKC